MAKVYQTIFDISGRLDGSLMGAISRATSAMKGLKDAGTFSSKVKPLQDHLSQLAQVQRALQRYVELTREMQRGKLGGGQMSELMQIARHLKAAGYSVDQLGKSVLRLKGDIAGTSHALGEFSRAAERLNTARLNTDQAGQNFSNAWSNMSNAVSTAQSIMAPVTSSVSTAMNYEAELSRSRALTQMDHIHEGNVAAIEREMTMLDAKYKEIGRTTQFSATQAAGAGNYLAMAGWNAPEINQGLSSVVNLAIAGGAGVERTADILSNIQTAFGLGKTESDIRRISDVLAYTVTHSNQDLSMLGETMKYAAPVAKMFGSSLEETAALTKFMADAGIQGSMAGTSLRATMLRLVAPPKRASKAMEENGITVDDAQKAWVNAQETAAEYGITLEETATPGKQMISIIKQIDAKMGGLSAHEKMAAFSAITGINAVSGALNIFEAGAPAIEDFITKLEGAEGAAAQTASVMADNLKGSKVSLESAFESLQINVGNAFLPMLKGAADGLTELTRAASGFAAEHPGLVRGFGGLAAALSAAVVGLGAFRLAMAGVGFVKTTVELMKATAAVKALTGAASSAGVITSLAGKIAGVGRVLMGFATGPWGLALAGVTTLIMANWDKIGPYFEKLWSVLKSGAVAAADAIGNALKSSGITDVIEGLMSKLGLIEKKKTALEAQSSARESIKETLKSETELTQEDKDKLQMSTRSRLREMRGRSEEEIAAELLETARDAKQTAATQAQIKEMWGAELSRRSDLTEEQRAAITERAWSGLQQMTREDVTGSLIEKYAASFKESGQTQGEYLSLVKEALQSGGQLDGAEMTRVLARLDERLTTAASTEQFRAELSKKEMPVKTLADQDALVGAMLKASAASELDLTSKLSAMETHVKGLSLGEQATSAMMASIREGLQARTDAALGGEVRGLVSKSEDTAALVRGLTELFGSQKDQSSEARRERAALAEREISKRYEGEELRSVLSELSASLKERSMERDTERATEIGAARKYEEAEMPGLKMMPAKLPWETSATLGKTTGFDAGGGIWSMLGDIFSSRAEGAAAPERQSLNIEGVQAAADQMASAVTNAGAGVEGLTASTQNAGAGVSMFGEMASASGALVQNLGAASEMAAASASAAGAGIDALGASSGAATGGVDGLGAAASGAQGGVGGLGEAAGGASGAVSGLGSAASSAIGALMSAASSAGAAISGALSSASAAISSFISPSIASNAVGGIYPRGEFVTTFAEDSPEAAIPIEKTKRSVGLWEKVGKMIGVLPEKKDDKPRKPRSIASGGNRIAMPAWVKPTIELADRLRRRKNGGDTSSSDAAPEEPKAAPMPKGAPMPMERRGRVGSIGRRPIMRSPSWLPFDPMKTGARWPLPKESKESSERGRLEEKVARYDRLEREEREVREQSDRQTTASDGGLPPITLSVTINGVSNRADVEQGVSAAVPVMRENLEDALARINHERSRRSYA